VLSRRKSFKIKAVSALFKKMQKNEKIFEKGIAFWEKI
jgi:hypothetical protein